MKKSILSITAAAVSVLAMTMSLASCEKDNNDKGNDDNTTDTNPIETISTDYSIEVSEDVLTYYDVTVTYGSDGNTEKTEAITSTKWNKTCTYSEGKLPGNVFCKAVMTPKAEHPSIDPETVYTVTKNKNCSVSAIYKNGKKSELNIYGNTSSNPIKGAKFEELLKKGEKVICDYSYSIKY